MKPFFHEKPTKQAFLACFVLNVENLNNYRHFPQPFFILLFMDI
jgi:hypothetical protein